MIFNSFSLKCHEYEKFWEYAKYYFKKIDRKLLCTIKEKYEMVICNPININCNYILWL